MASSSRDNTDRRSSRSSRASTDRASSSRANPGRGDASESITTPNISFNLDSELPPMPDHGFNVDFQSLETVVRATEIAKANEQRTKELIRIRAMLETSKRALVTMTEIHAIATEMGPGNCPGGADRQEVEDEITKEDLQEIWPPKRGKYKAVDCTVAAVRERSLQRFIEVKGTLPKNSEFSMTFARQVLYEITRETPVNYASRNWRQGSGSGSSKRAKNAEDEAADGDEPPTITYLLPKAIQLLEVAGLATAGHVDEMTALKAQLENERQRNITLAAESAKYKAKAEAHDLMAAELEHCKLLLQGKDRELQTVQTNNEHLMRISTALQSHPFRVMSEGACHPIPPFYLYERQWKSMLGMDYRYCAYCGDDLTQSGWYTLGCGHRFHMRCMLDTMQADRICPTAACGYIMPDLQYATFNMQSLMPALPHLVWRRYDGFAHVFQSVEEMEHWRSDDQVDINNGEAPATKTVFYEEHDQANVDEMTNVDIDEHAPL